MTARTLGCVSGIAVWLLLLIYMSLLPFVDAVTATPLDRNGIVWAVIWFFLSKIIGIAAGFVIALIFGMRIKGTRFSS